MWSRRLALFFLLFSFRALSLMGQMDIRINDDPAGSLQESPAIAVGNDGAILVAWIDNRSGTTPRIYISRSTDGGSTWSTNVPASSPDARPTGGMEMGPGLAITKDNHVYLNWADIRRSPDWKRVDIYMTRSSDGGASFGDDARINNDSTEMQHQPAMAAGPDGTVYSVWHAFPSSGSDQATPVFAARTTPDGASFEPQSRVDFYQGKTPVGSCNCCRPWIFADEITGALYVAFRIDSANYRDIFLSRSTDRGVTWEAARRVSKGMWRFNACPGSGPAGYAYNGTVVVSWMDQRNQGEPQTVYVARSTDGGENFGEDVEVGKPANFPSVVMDREGRIFVAWNGRGADGHIYGSISTDGGVTFSAPRQVNSRAPSGENQAPACAVAPDGSVYCVWQDRREDYGDIYFSKLSTLVAGVPAPGAPFESTEAAIDIIPGEVTTGSGTEIRFSHRPLSAAVYNQLGEVVHRFIPGELRQHVIFQLRGVYYVVAEFGMARQMKPIVIVR